jgi:hypothetical protein
MKTTNRLTPMESWSAHAVKSFDGITTINRSSGISAPAALFTIEEKGGKKQKQVYAPTRVVKAMRRQISASSYRDGMDEKKGVVSAALDALHSHTKITAGFIRYVFGMPGHKNKKAQPTQTP